MEKNEPTLSEEIKTYQEKKDNLLSNHAGKFVLIKGKEIIDVFDTKNDAIKVGIDKFGNSPFLVKKISEVDETHNFTSNMLGVIKCPQ